MKLLRSAAALLAVLLVSFLAPIRAKADSITKTQAETDLIDVALEAELDPAYYASKTAETDLSDAESAFSMGNFDTEIADLDGVLKSLGLPPLGGPPSGATPEPSTVLLLVCGVTALLLAKGRAKAGTKKFA